MVAIGVFELALVSSVVIAVVLTALGYLIVRLIGAASRRLGGTLGSRLLTALGIAISVAGFIGLVWIQAQQITPSGFGQGFGIDGAARWQLAMEPIMVIGIGLLVAVAAQMLRVVQLRLLVSNVEAGALES